MRIGLVSCRHPINHDEDLDFLVPALRRRGAVAEPVVWDDPKVSWADFDLALVSSTWDYDSDPGGFRAWARAAGKATRLQNPAATIVWNLDKRYLRELEAAGVPTIPTIWTEPGAEDEIEATVAELGWSDIVLKPVIDLGARRLARVETEMVGRILRAIDGPAMAQPFLPALQSEGELSVVLIAGEPSHAIRKLPARGDFRVQSQYGGSAELLPVSAEAERVALAALAAAPGEPLYARADMIRNEAGELRLIELELIEPNLYLGLERGAAEALARAALAVIS